MTLPPTAPLVGGVVPGGGKSSRCFDFVGAPLRLCRVPSVLPVDFGLILSKGSRWLRTANTRIPGRLGSRSRCSPEPLSAIAWLSEILVGAIEPSAHELGLSNIFVGVFVVAILGNAAEHATAITAAMKNRMDLSLSIAIGSSVQVALFVAPLLVLASLVVGPPPIDLFSARALFSPYCWPFSSPDRSPATAGQIG